MAKLFLFFVLILSASLVRPQAADSLICSKIERDYNEFEKTTTLTTPLLKSCSLNKVITQKATAYYLSLVADGITPLVYKKGVKVILSNGQILSFPQEEIDVKVSDDGRGYKYSAFISLIPGKLALLKKFTVLKWQLYIYDGSQSEAEADEFKALVNCIAGMK